MFPVIGNGSCNGMSTCAPLTDEEAGNEIPSCEYFHIPLDNIAMYCEVAFTNKYVPLCHDSQMLSPITAVLEITHARRILEMFQCTAGEYDKLIRTWQSSL